MGVSGGVGGGGKGVMELRMGKLSGGRKVGG